MRNPRVLDVVIACLGILYGSFAFGGLDTCKHSWSVNLGTDDSPVAMQFCWIPLQDGGDSFFMGRTTVTKGQYFAVMEERPWITAGNVYPGWEQGPDDDDPEYPSSFVPLIKAIEFADKLAERVPGFAIFIPTEEEWLYASKDPDSPTTFYWGNSPQAVYAVIRRAKPLKVEECPDAYMEKQAAGYCANPHGLMHMFGNMWEWTHNKRELPANKIIGPWYSGQRSPTSMLMGGSYSTAELRERKSFVSDSKIGKQCQDISFRVAARRKK